MGPSAVSAGPPASARSCMAGTRFPVQTASASPRISRIDYLFAMTRRRQTYAADGITVTFDPDVCIHSGVCVMGLSDVFDIKRKRWIRPELQPADVVAAQVMRCPS